MKNLDVSHLVLAALLALAIIWGVNQRNSKVTAQSQLNANRIMSNPEAKLVKRFTDSLKQKHATFDVTDNKIDGKVVAVSKPLLDSLAKKSDVKPSEVTDWKEVATSTEARALKAEKQVDSLKKSIYFSYSDKNVKLAFHPALDSASNGTFDFHYDADLSVLSYTKRAKFLLLPIGQKMNYTDIYSNDPRTTINGLKTFSIEHSDPFVGLRLQAGGSYSFRTKNYVFGPAAQLYLDRWSVVGTYFYSPVDNRFAPSVGFRYDIFR